MDFVFAPRSKPPTNTGNFKLNLIFMLIASNMSLCGSSPVLFCNGTFFTGLSSACIIFLAKSFVYSFLSDLSHTGAPFFLPEPCLCLNAAIELTSLSIFNFKFLRYVLKKLLFSFTLEIEYERIRYYYTLPYNLP